MITLKFLGTWVKITVIAALVLVLEVVLVHSFGWFLLLAGVTVLGYVGLTAALWREWRSARNYGYQYIHNTWQE